jgi:hypothetical protein
MSGSVRQQYEGALHQEMAVPPGRLGAVGKPRRVASIREAIAFPMGRSVNEKAYTQISPDLGGFQVALGKPGKEAAPGYKRPNPNDMLPTVFFNGQCCQDPVSFNHITDGFEELTLEDDPAALLALDVIGCLLFRAAFMLDHGRMGGGWRLVVPPAALSAVEAGAPNLSGLPAHVFLHLLDALAWNEDVKYNPNADQISGTGRQNTLLTTVKVIAVLLHRLRLSTIVGGMSQGRGVSGITQAGAIAAFPLLDPAYRWGR